MQLYHIDCEGILEYINDLEDVQAKSERKKKTITNTMLVIIAKNTMLSTEELPEANKD